MEKFPEAEEAKKVDSQESGGEKYNFPPEVYLNPNSMPSVGENQSEAGIEMLQTNVAYQNMMGETLENHVLHKNMSSEEIEALATAMVEQYEESSIETEEAQVSEIFEVTEAENKEEVVKQKEGSESSIFSRAVEVMKEYLVKYPKVARLAVVGMLAYEMGNNPAMADDSFGRMISSGTEGASRYAYSQQAGQERIQYNAMYGDQRVRLQYQGDIQRAEQQRQREYSQLDDAILRAQSSERYKGTQEQENKIAGQVYKIRMQIEQRYRQNVSNAQMRAQATQQNTQMRAQEIEMQNKMRQQQIAVGVGSQIANQAINGMIHGVFGR